MNPETYPWTQADAEDYNSSDPPEEQAVVAVAPAQLDTDYWEPENASLEEQWEQDWERWNAEREALESFNEVPSYFERYAVRRAWREFVEKYGK